MPASATLVRGAVSASWPPYVLYGFAVWDSAGVLVVAPDTGSAGVELTPGMTGAQADAAAKEAMGASLAQNYPGLDTAGMVVVVL